MPNEKTRLTIIRGADSNGPAPQATLRDTVRNALLELLKDPASSAAAKASAGRTLVKYFDDTAPNARRGADMTAEELDAAIDRARSDRATSKKDE